MSQKLFVKFYAENLSLNNAPLLNRSIEVDSYRIKILLENNQCHTMQK